MRWANRPGPGSPLAIGMAGLAAVSTAGPRGRSVGFPGGTAADGVTGAAVPAGGAAAPGRLVGSTAVDTGSLLVASSAGSRGCSGGFGGGTVSDGVAGAAVTVGGAAAPGLAVDAAALAVDPGVALVLPVGSFAAVWFTGGMACSALEPRQCGQAYLWVRCCQTK
jgi:hypothetical protein